MNLSDHFALDELCRTAQRDRNVPGPEQKKNLRRLAQTALEPLRALWGHPIRVTSGFRCPRVNEAVGGAPTSAHLDGRAADTVPLGLALDAAFEQARKSTVPYDQLILEPGWVHVAIAREEQAPRRQALVAEKVAGKMVYRRVEG